MSLKTIKLFTSQFFLFIVFLSEISSSPDDDLKRAIKLSLQDSGLPSVSSDGSGPTDNVSQSHEHVGSSTQSHGHTDSSSQSHGHTDSSSQSHGHTDSSVQSQQSKSQPDSDSDSEYDFCNIML